MTAENIEEVSAVVGGPRGTGCWCQRFTGNDGSDKRAAFEFEVLRSGEPPGLVALRNGRCVGWSRVGLRSSLPGVMANRALSKVFAEDQVSPDAAWWITCFAVPRSERGRGIGVTLLRAAVDFARSHGGRVLDGHPVDVARLRARPSPSAVFTGTLSMFEAAGFAEIGRTYVSRPVMRARL
jgi:GNAT superfamily N-acetyltransferase